MVVKFVSFFLRHLGMPRPERSRADTVPCRYSSRRVVAAHLANRAQQGRSWRPRHPERSPIRARVASVKRVLVIQLDHDLDSFLTRARPLWELPLPCHNIWRVAADSGLVRSARKRIRGRKCGRAAAPPKSRPASHGPFCCALTFSDGTITKQAADCRLQATGEPDNHLKLTKL